MVFRSRARSVSRSWWSARLLLIAALVSAQLLGPTATAWAAESVEGVIDNLTVWIVGLSAGLATLFLTVGGLRYWSPEVIRARSRPVSGR